TSILGLDSLIAAAECTDAYSHPAPFPTRRSSDLEVVTERIETFTERGVRLGSGRELEADTIVSATGLELQLFGGMQLAVDGRPFVAAESMGYRGLMLRDLPNAAVILGYTNASWTLKADLSSRSEEHTS